LGDKFTKEKRSNIMSKISGKETKPEILVRKYLFTQGFRFRKYVTKLPGKPDIFLPKYKTVIFVNGCFWHGHQDCKRSVLPSSNKEFWELKISKNIERDEINKSEILKLGYKVIIIWQCELLSKVRVATLNNLIKLLKE
jgi:DNA mismatch endonuclease (patch repair protein)